MIEQTIPSHLQIETLHKVCNARCRMCVIELSKRTPDLMSIENYTKILNKFLPYQESIKYVSLVGLSEILLDKHIIDRVRIAKDMGFKGVGFPTNCSFLTEKMSLSLIKVGLDTLICSIDGFTKETQELLKGGTEFEEIISNVKRFINIRNELSKSDSKVRTKILVRFIYQNDNKHEWNDFYNHWTSFLNKDFGDDVIKFNIHNCGNILKDYKSVNTLSNIQNTCSDIFDRFIILSNGDIAFCCGGHALPYLGNIFHDDPIEIYNNQMFTHYRKEMNEGKIKELEYCKDCTIPQSRAQGKYQWK